MPVQTWKKLLGALAALVALALVAAACGDDDDDTSADEPAAEEPAEEEPAAEEPAEEEPAEEEPAEEEPAEEDMAPEQSEVRLGLIPIADVAPVFIGIEQGFFEEEGLTVTTEYAAGGAAAIPTVIAGDIDFAFGAYPSFYSSLQNLATDPGNTLIIATEVVREADLFAGLYSLPDSGIETPADMAGATVAVNTLDNLVQLAVEAQLVDAGLSLDDVTLVEIGFPDMAAALESGDVDVISVVEPFGTIARNTLDAHLVIDMFEGRVEGWPVAGFYVTQAFLEENPNTVAGFNRAFAKATEFANADPDAVPQVLPTYIDTTVEASRALNLPEFVSGIDVDLIQTVGDFMVDSGLLDAPIDVSEYVVAG